MSAAPAPRVVTLVLVDEAGTVLGALPPFPVSVPWWPETWDIVDGARDRFGLDVAVLRLLSAEPAAPHGGRVTYLAQVTVGVVAVAPLAAAPPVDPTPQPRRPPYAEPGGPAESLRWATAALDAAGRGPVQAVSQRRTWNLSAIWRLGTPSGPVWLKQVPPFFAHEAAVLEWIAASGHADRVPGLIAADAGRMLLEHIPGEGLFGVPAAVRDTIAADLHPVQLHAAGHLDALLRAGVPDRRAPALAGILTAVVARHRPDDPRLATLVDGLPRRLDQVGACGLPDTLLHGDLHPGNVHRGVDGAGHVIIDWGDSAVGNPAFDVLRLIGDCDGTSQGTLLAAWAARWRSAVPGCDPLRAVELLRPVEALRAAAVYARFLDDIEPSEHPYHAADVPHWLDQAAALTREGNI